MGLPVRMMSNEFAVASVTILDEGGEPFTEKPEGYTTKFESSDTNILGVNPRANGIEAELTSDGIGVATLTISTQDANGNHLQDSPDSFTVTVANAKPKSQNATVSAPQPEV